MTFFCNACFGCLGLDPSICVGFGDSDDELVLVDVFDVVVPDAESGTAGNSD
jgi:hypothetical protein